MGKLKDWWKERKDKKAAKKEAKKAGPEVYGDKDLKRFKKPESLGGGTANDVYKTDYGSTGMGKGFFKPDQQDAPAKLGVGASTIAKKLGMDDIIPDTKFATHEVKGPDGTKSVQSGAVSKAVAGVPLMKPNWGTEDVMPTLPKDVTLDTVRTDESYKANHRVNKDGTVNKKSGSQFNNDIDLKNPETQRGMNRLQWFDSISGNDDRHGGNIMVDPETGKVSGIDNDLILTKGGGLKEQDGSTDARFNEGWGKHLGLPSRIDQSTADAILAVTPAELEETLRSGDGPLGKMADKDIKQAKERLEEVHKAVQKLIDDGKVVAKWNDDTYAETIHEERRTETKYRSYAQQHLAQLADSDDPRYAAQSTRSNPGKAVELPPKPVAKQPAPPPEEVKAPSKPRPTGGLKRPNQGAMRKGKVPGTTGPQSRPSGGTKRPNQGAMRGGKVPGTTEESESGEKEASEILQHALFQMKRPTRPAPKPPT